MNAKTKIPFAYRFVRWAFPLLEKVAPSMAAKWAVKLFFTPIRFPMRPSEKEYLDNAEKFVLEIDSRKVTCYSFGEGTPVIMVHGWSGHGLQFGKLAKAFNNYGYRVITFDAPGHGLSDGSSTSVLEFSMIITALVENFKANVLIGHSLGGVASLLAISNGLPVKNLLMINSPSMSDQIIEEFLRKINGSKKSGTEIKKYVEELTNKPFEQFMPLHAIKSIKGLNLELIHDELDKEVPFAHALALKEEYPGANLVKTSGLGHSRILSSREVINASLAFTYRS